jgi:hypothetical protein
LQPNTATQIKKHLRVLFNFAVLPLRFLGAYGR